MTALKFRTLRSSSDSVAVSVGVQEKEGEGPGGWRTVKGLVRQVFICIWTFVFVSESNSELCLLK